MKDKAIQFLRGGQIFDYKTKTMIRVSNRILKVAILGYVCIVIFVVFLTSYPQLKLLSFNAYANFLKHIGYGDKYVWEYNGVGGIAAMSFLKSSLIQSTVMHAKSILIKNTIKILGICAIFYIGVIAYFSHFFINKGKKYCEDKFISGTRLATSLNEVNKSVTKGERGVSDIKLLNLLSMPYRSEFQGFLFHGTTGAGKTQAIMRLLDEIKRLGEPAIIYDKECTIKPYFFDKAIDVELNPVSKDCQNWDLWLEADNPMELGNLTSYLIPKSVQGSDPFWVDSARTIFSSMTWKIRNSPERNPIFLLQLLLTTNLDEIRGILKGTESENLVSKEIEKTAISIKSVLATYTKSLRFLAGLNQENAPKFSIKEWIKSVTDETTQKKGWLFITSRSKYHKEIKPLISLWLGLAMQGVQSLKANTNKRIWIVMDELASLHRLETLSDTLADIRKFGGCVAVGIQSISQLEFLYGNHEAHAISDLLNTSLYFRSPKSRTAKWVSEDLGEQIIEEVKESQSYGLDSIRDGNTIATQRVIRKTVDSGNIMMLNDLECYVKLVGNHPISKLKIDYIHRNELVDGLIERKIDFDALEKINKNALNIENNDLVNNDVKKIRAFEAVSSSFGDKGSAFDESIENDMDVLKKAGVEALCYDDETRF